MVSSCVHICKPDQIRESKKHFQWYNTGYDLWNVGERGTRIRKRKSVSEISGICTSYWDRVYLCKWRLGILEDQGGIFQVAGLGISLISGEWGIVNMGTGRGLYCVRFCDGVEIEDCSSS